jgi:hypothetical protein
VKLGPLADITEWLGGGWMEVGGEELPCFIRLVTRLRPCVYEACIYEEANVTLYDYSSRMLSKISGVWGGGVLAICIIKLLLYFLTGRSYNLDRWKNYSSHKLWAISILIGDTSKLLKLY